MNLGLNLVVCLISVKGSLFRIVKQGKSHFFFNYIAIFNWYFYRYNIQKLAIKISLES
jgi:hypothetical protein